ncbi:MAG: amylo-alpha-1,6-glucosidase [Phycisphaerae bacterium]
MPLYEIETYGEMHPHLSREWLLTNGRGAFASSSVIGCNTRRYHGLLVAATLPPVGRIMAVNRVAERLRFLDEAAHESEPVELAINFFREQVHPMGYHYLRRFSIDDTVRWEYHAHGIRIVKELQLLWHRNVIGIRYHVDPQSRGMVRLEASPFVSLRDFHSLRRAGEVGFDVSPEHQAVTVKNRDMELRLAADAGQYVHQPDWWYHHSYPIERRRGLDDAEDLFTPGHFAVEGDKPFSFCLWAGMEGLDGLDWDHAVEERNRCRPEKPMPTKVQQRLVRAASDFVVKRKTLDQALGVTIIAGYPWFADWGRDTMISLPGLMLTTGRYQEAGRVLSVYAGYVAEGMVPNRFDDYTDEPQYNTVDASLWFIHASFAYLRHTRDEETFQSMLKPACREVIDGYRRGTRFNIAMDDDGLITAGDVGTQLTWMDAKCDNVAFTPRHGKAVEINALWYNALMLMEEAELARKVKASFVEVFWQNAHRGLADCMNTGGLDTAIRPNQILAASLPHKPLDKEQCRAVVDVVRRELLTSYGLRTLSPTDPFFQDRYQGDQFNRDKAYHNGTIWPWLIGHFLEAYLAVNDNTPAAREQARHWLRPLTEHLERDGCVGSISEIFEAASPHRPDGCFAQAWSVAEVLRLAVELEM